MRSDGTAIAVAAGTIAAIAAIMAAAGTAATIAGIAVAGMGRVIGRTGMRAGAAAMAGMGRGAGPNGGTGTGFVSAGDACGLAGGAGPPVLGLIVHFSLALGP